MNDQYSIQYPRKVALRAILKRLARLILPVMCRVEVNGASRIPQKGPVILAGNHVAVMEIVMMMAYAPRQVEFVGAGDIPLDPTMAPYANLYGFIPIRRGMVDRTGMRAARDVLLQNGILVVFPEGGIWDPAGMNARLGVAWLSQQAQAPVVPVGFGGMRGALVRMLRFQRPRLVMNVGEPIPAMRPMENKQNHRESLDEYAQVIFSRIQSLVPQSERDERPARAGSAYELQVVLRVGGQVQDVSSELSASQRESVAQFFCQPVLLDALRRNLRLNVSPLQQLDRIVDASVIGASLRTVLEYLDRNPGFLTYRFGMSKGIDAAEGIKALAEIAERAWQRQQEISIHAAHRYLPASGGQEAAEPFSDSSGVGGSVDPKAHSSEK